MGNTGNTKKIRNLLDGKSGTLLIVLVFSVVVFYIINPAYLSSANVKTVFNACSTSGIMAVGMGCLLISGSIDLSSGAIGMFAGVIIALLLQTDMPWGVAFVVTVLGACCIGLLNAFFVNVLNFIPFISTLGTMTVLTGLGGILSNGQAIVVNNKSFWELGSITVFNVVPLPFVLMVFVFAVYGCILSGTIFGRRVYMCGGNRNAVRLAGINHKAITTVLFVSNAALSAVTGIIFTSRMHNAIYTSVLGQEMTGLTAAILGGIGFKGGTGGMVGAFIGLILLNSFTSGLLVAGLNDYWRIVANGVLLIAALTLDYVREKSRIKSQKTAAMKDA